MPRCRTYLSSSGTPVHTCCLRFCPRNSSSSSHHGNVSINDDIQYVGTPCTCLYPSSVVCKSIFQFFLFPGTEKPATRTPSDTQPASQPVSPACPAQCRERATSQKTERKGREGKGRRLTREDGRPCATRFRKASSHIVVRACVRACAVSCFIIIIVFRQFAPRMEPVFLLQRRAPPRKKKSIIRVRYDVVSQTITELM